MKRATGIFDKNGREVMEGDGITLSCDCCHYDVIWDELKGCWWPQDDGYSQIHLKDIDVWKCKFESYELEK